MSNNTKKDSWNSQLGVIMAVAGAAVGLGNFLRFPGQAAQFGAGAFMIAYFLSLLILGLPMCWFEWVSGRHGGQRGFSAPPGILLSLWRHPMAKYIGTACVVTLLMLYTYYSYVEAWCLGYAYNFITGNINFTSVEQSKNFWENFIGTHADGAGLTLSTSTVGPFLLIAFAINFYLVYRGISKGIEKYVKFAVPTLIIIALFVLVRVLTLGMPDAEKPWRTTNNGLGYMWNPTKHVLYEKNDEGEWSRSSEVIGKERLNYYHIQEKAMPDQVRIETVTMWQQLKKPKLWLAAASQVFFSLSVGFGAVMVYASYMRRDDDLVLSSLTAMSANEFTEVAIGGTITLPAAYAFLGASGIIGQSVFGLGFNVLPMIFSMMPLGNIFGGLFFFLLFLAAISGVLCQLQCGIAYFEEVLSIDRKRAVLLTSIIATFGSIIVFYFSKDLKGMDTMDFWIGTFFIFVLSMINIIIFGWAFGTDKIYKEAHRGAAIRIPNLYKYIIKYICPIFLLAIFSLWIGVDVLGIGNTSIDYHIKDIFGPEPSKVAILTLSTICITILFLCMLTAKTKKYRINRD